MHGIVATEAAWAFPAERSTDRLVLLAIAFHADEHGRSWPSIDRLCDLSRLDKKSVIASIKRLEASGGLFVSRGNGRGNQYVIETSAKNGTSTKCGTGTEIGTQPAPKTEPDQYQKRNTNIAKNKAKEQGNLFVETAGISEPAPVPKPSSVPCPVKEIVAIYNEVTAGKLPQCRDITDARRASIASGWRNLFRGSECKTKEEGLETVRDYLACVCSKPFCIGENDRHWRATIDKVFKPSFIAGMREGRYDPRR